MAPIKISEYLKPPKSVKQSKKVYVSLKTESENLSFRM